MFFMSKSTYCNLKRFETNQATDFWDFMACLRIPAGAVFECWTMHNTLAYLCTTDRIGNYLFDLCECDALGEPAHRADRFYSVSLRDIAERLYEGDWRFLPLNAG
jgi:hypothetical protein